MPSEKNAWPPAATRARTRGRREARALRSLLSCVLLAAPLGARPVALAPLVQGEAGERSATDDRLRWEALPVLRDTPGLGGPFVGTAGGALIVAGGANFPIAPPWDGGEKVWYPDVRLLEDGGASWRPMEPLPGPRAYGVAVSVPDGMLLVGGESAEAVHADAWLLTWNAREGALRREPLPALPEPVAFAAGALVGDEVVVFGGRRSADPLDLVPRGWRIDPSAPETERRWRALPACPGGPRLKAVGAAQPAGDGAPRFLMFGGELPRRGADGAIDREPLRDAWSLDLRTETWTPIAEPPRPVTAACAVASGQSHVLVFGGAEGLGLDRPLAERNEFTREVLAYHTITDTWTRAGTMPEGVVTSGVVRWRDGFALASGELRPGVRTPQVRLGRVAREGVGFGTLNAIVLGSYLGMLVLLGFWFSRREGTTRDYFLASGRVPWWAAGLSIFATQLSAITFIATPAVAFSSDWALLPTWLGIFLFAPIAARCYLPFFRRLGCTTAYEYLERRFHVAVRTFGSASFIVYQFARMAIVVFLPALTLSTITGIDIHLCILLMGVLATLYTTLGGIEAVVWTDVLQVVVLVGGMFAGLLVLAGELGGVGATWELAREGGRLEVLRGGWSIFELTTWSLLVGGFFLQFGPYTTDQAVVQRYLTTTDERSAARGIWLNGWLAVPGGFLFLVVGAALYAYYRVHPEGLALGMQNDEVLPLFVATKLPVGLSGLVIAGVFAASMSSLDSSMHSVATALATDFRRRFGRPRDDAAELRWARAATVSIGVVATAVSLLLAALDVRSILFLFIKCLGLLSSGLAGVFVLGVFTTRASWKGALVGAFVSTAIVGWVTFSTPVHAYFYSAVGIPTCVLVGYGASLALPDRRQLAGITWWTRKEQA